MENLIKSTLFGIATGDALGVPVEFKSRDYLKENPVTYMLAYGTHNQPRGTWSDDSSLTFCLAESLSLGYDLNDLAKRFIHWYSTGYWTPHGKVFDIGIATSMAINQLIKNTHPTFAGGVSVDSNGNGSLMRILPLLFYIKDLSIEKRFQMTKEVSSLTHAHIRSILACFIYLEMARLLILEKDKWIAYEKMQKLVLDFLEKNAICSQAEQDHFHRILNAHSNINYQISGIQDYLETEIDSSGYVVHSLEASLWCLLKTNSFKECILKAVNLGSDTDTTGAIAGGLAGILYGIENIPNKWLNQLARKADIEDLANRFAKSLALQDEN